MVLVYQNAIGINLAIYTLFDLTGYSTLSYVITKPSGTKITVVPSVTNLTTGELAYITVAGDFDEVGQYKGQVIVTYSDGDVIKGEIDDFTIYTPL